MNQPVAAFLSAACAEWIGAGGILNGAKVVPYANQITPTVNTQYTDLGVITLPGITPVTPSWFGPSLQNDRSWGVLGSQCRFQLASAAVPAIINGFAVFSGPGGGSGTGNVLIYCDALPQPLQLFDVSQVLSYVPLFTWGSPGTFFSLGQALVS